MKKIFLTVVLTVSICAAPVLVLMILWDYTFTQLDLSHLACATRMGLVAAPVLFPLVLTGTIISCRPSVEIRMRPLVICLGILGTGITGFVSAWWYWVLTHGFME